MEMHEVLASREELQCEDDDSITKALQKLHKNLGHPATHDLVRILKHGSASNRAIELAKNLSCDFCKANIRPHVPLPARPNRVNAFNQSVGVDVKWLPGFKPNQQIKALNMVDQGSCFQQVVPFFEQETTEVIRKLFDTHWVKWAGPPQEIIVDQARTNLGEAFQGWLDNQGVSVRMIPAGAHWQLGRTESHGGWFGRVLDRVIQEHAPSNQAEWEECVRHAHVKNHMIQSYGYTPHQHVFGRNPELPGDLLNEPLHVVPGTAGLSDDAVARAQAIRTSARHAVIALQDDKALRHALAARPRATIHFCPGDLVCYWRNQKLVGKGVVQQGGRWYGTAVIIGQIGKNWIVAHRRQIIRCAPEQLRPATTEERTLISSPQAELLGVKDLIEGGTFKSHQLIDLVPGHYPTSESSQQSPDTGTQENPDVQKPAVDEKAVTPPSVQPMTRDDEPKPTIQPPDWNAEQSNVPSNTSSASTDRPRDTPQAEPSSYGPIRRRVDQKSGATALYRPAAMRQEDFLEVIKEVVPRLIDEAMQPTDESMDAGLKRPLTPSHADEVQEPPTSKHRGSEDDEVLSVEEINQHLSQGSIESLIAAYMEKKLSKEIPPSKNPPELQKLVDESKGVEWNTIADKQAIRLHFGKKALKIKEQFADRFIGSRFVIIRKAIQDGPG